MQEIISEYMASIGKKGGSETWKKMSEQDKRAKIMKMVAARAEKKQASLLKVNT